MQTVISCHKRRPVVHYFRRGWTHGHGHTAIIYLKAKQVLYDHELSLLSVSRSFYLAMKIYRRPTESQQGREREIILRKLEETWNRLWDKIRANGSWRFMPNTVSCNFVATSIGNGYLSVLEWICHEVNLL